MNGKPLNPETSFAQNLLSKEENPSRREQLFLEHPDESPEWVEHEMHYLIHPPSRLSSTAAWIRFRDMTLLPMIESHSNDPNLANFAKQVQKILDWRDTVAPEERFWKADPK